MSEKIKYSIDYKKYEEKMRQAIAEGQVLLENRNNTLPIERGSRVSVFGRMQNHYYKSGTGSGGMVNVTHVVGIYDALLAAHNEGKIILNEKLNDIYRAWDKENPLLEGVGWGNDPWNQPEMPLSYETVREASDNSDIAVVIIARLAGEDKDSKAEEGSYYLTGAEKDMLKLVRESFRKMVVVLNTGNIMDMSWVKIYDVDAVLYSWQGGMFGGLGCADVLLGDVNPSGRLADTIALNINDYPSTKNFNQNDTSFYEEDIFVGYRYFETFAKDKVLYPFGYGLSYTTFNIDVDTVTKANDYVAIDVTVTNVGFTKGKEVVQVYVKAPMGRLSKPARVLGGFAKTNVLEPAQSQTLHFDIPFRNFASFDDMNACELGSGFVLEAGKYEFYIGENVRSAKCKASVNIEETYLLEALERALGPYEEFNRMIIDPNSVEGEDYTVAYEKAPLREDTQKERRDKDIPADIEMTGDLGYKLKDVLENRITMNQFVAQFSEDELMTIIRGEGMGSVLVTAGTAAAVGGIIPSIREKGVPVGCMDDGPSGMRLDSGVKAYSLPNGTCLACTFNTKLNEELFEMLGIEMLKNKVDCLLGPGMNIHRNPLNGRNFEYFSEDPILTGEIGLAQIKGLKTHPVTGTIKHFACNNQEFRRHYMNPVVSERALREIYLRGFEIAVKGGADAVMTTYCPLNNIWTAGNYDLCTTVLRKQWGFKGIVMTDWWAQISDEETAPGKANYGAMVRAQNDIYMCVPGALDYVGDDTKECLENGTLTIGELQRTARNVCRFLMDKGCFIREFGDDIEIEEINAEEGFENGAIEVDFVPVKDNGSIDLSGYEVKKGGEIYFGAQFEDMGLYEVTLVGRGMPGNNLAQLPAVLFVYATPNCSFTYNGTGEWTEITQTIYVMNKTSIMHLYFALGGLELKEIRFKSINKLM